MLTDSVTSLPIEENCDEVFEIPAKRPPGRPTASGRPVLIKTSMTECDNCHEVCRKGVMYERHTLKTHPEDQKKCLCKFCSCTFFTMDELLNHVTEHWTVGSVCPLSEECNCAIAFKRRATVLSHLINKHLNNQDSIIESVKCNVKKSSKNKENPLTCGTCFKVFSKPCLLDRHVRIHTKEKPFVCSICGFKFSQKNSLILHNLTHTNSLPHKCSKCPAAFNQFVNLKNHIKSLHPAVIPLNALNCPYCPSFFQKNHTLQMHIDKFHKKCDDQMINDTIIDVMNSLATLDDQSATDIVGIHNNLFSNDDLDLLSEKDTNMLVERDLLLNTNILDKSKTTENIKKCFECQTCGKIFKKNSDLTRHVTIHLNIRPFSCDLCDKKFRLNTMLVRHKKNTHKNSSKGALEEFVKKSDIKNDQNVSDNCENNVLDSCINSLDLSPADISNQISFESREIFENVLNNDDDLRFNSIPIDSVNQNNFDADVSLLFNNSSLSTEIDSENLNIESNFIVLHSNFPVTTNTDHPETNESQISQMFEQNTFLDNNSLTLDISQVTENICSENNVNEEQDSLNNIISFSTSDINYVVDNYTNIDLNVIKCDVDVGNSLKDDINIPTISIPNSKMIHADSEPVIFPEGPNVDLNEEITDIDILKFIQVNNVENPEEPVKKADSKKKCETMRNELAIVKDAFKLNKCKYKDPPLANRCQICPASFGKPSDLIRHSRVHTREKPFACKTCGDSFSIKSTLLIHERKHVAAQKRIKYMCQVCGKRFTNSSALSLHKSIHLEKRSHICPICSATFRTSGHLDTHLITHLKNKCDKSNTSRKKIPKLMLLNDIDLQ